MPVQGAIDSCPSLSIHWVPWVGNVASSAKVAENGVTAVHTAVKGKVTNLTHKRRAPLRQPKVSILDNWQLQGIDFTC